VAASSASASSSTMCMLCSASAATLQCVQCEGDPYCNRCWDVHVRQKTCRTHQSAPLGKAVVAPAMCPKHPSMELMYCCTVDQDVFCALCFPGLVSFLFLFHSRPAHLLPSSFSLFPFF
jgi:hypothetical protein